MFDDGDAPGVVRDAAERVAAAVAAVPTERIDAAPADEVTAALRAVDAAMVRLTAVQLALVAAQRQTSVWQSRGDRSYEAWRGRVTRTGDRVARQEARLADAVQTVPAAGEALAQGEITPEHVSVLARLTSGPQPSPRVAKEVRGSGGAELVTMARSMNAAEFARAADRWAASLDADAVETSFQRVRARRHLRVFPSSGGVRIDGLLDPVAGHTLTLALEAATPRPAADDQRSADQRRADALTDIATRSLDAGDTKADALVRPHLSLLLSEHTWAGLRARRHRDNREPQPGHSAPGSSLRRSSAPDPNTGRIAEQPTDQAVTPPAPSNQPEWEPATTEDGLLIPPSVLEQLACDCELTRIVLDAHSQPVDVGRTQRSFTRHIRRAIIARDRHCRWPHCTHPARWCQVHHITYWTHHGTTTIDNGITLCSFHHHQIHNGTATITPIPGGHRFTTPTGQHLGDSLRHTPATQTTPDPPQHFTTPQRPAAPPPNPTGPPSRAPAARPPQTSAAKAPGTVARSSARPAPKPATRSLVRFPAGSAPPQGPPGPPHPAADQPRATRPQPDVTGLQRASSWSRPPAGHRGSDTDRGGSPDTEPTVPATESVLFT